jgi:ankyrin repeat protein
MNIHSAARNGKLNRVSTLLNRGVSVNARNAYGFTPLHKAASGGHVNVVKELLKRGAHVNPRTHQGYTPLHFGYLHPRVIHTLIKAGANPKYRNINGTSVYNFVQNNATRNALKTSRAVSKWNNTVRKRRAERMLLSPRLLGSTILNNKSIANIARYLTVKKV